MKISTTYTTMDGVIHYSHQDAETYAQNVYEIQRNLVASKLSNFIAHAVKADVSVNELIASWLDSEIWDLECLVLRAKDLDVTET